FHTPGTATTERYTLSLHVALPICVVAVRQAADEIVSVGLARRGFHLFACGVAFAVGDVVVNRVVEQNRILRHHADLMAQTAQLRSEEHTSELQSRSDLVCRLLLEK